MHSLVHIKLHNSTVYILPVSEKILIQKLTDMALLFVMMWNGIPALQTKIGSYIRTEIDTNLVVDKINEDNLYLLQSRITAEPISV